MPTGPVEQVELSLRPLDRLAGRNVPHDPVRQGRLALVGARMPLGRGLSMGANLKNEAREARWPIRSRGLNLSSNSDENDSILIYNDSILS